MGFAPNRPLTTLALLLALPLGAQDARLGQRRMDLPGRENPALEGREADRPDLRRDWNLWWFGGKLSPEYMDFKNRAAAREIQRWGRLLPTAQTSRLAPAIAGTASAPSGTGGTWMNLGPTTNLTSASWPDIDSGRPSAIAMDPASSTLYLAASGGGVWKCTNADPNSSTAWAWTPITDGLPTSGASGNVSAGALAMSPSNALVLYLGLGDAFDAEGRGFYKSTDGGSTWTAATGLGAQTRSYDILALDANIILWGTNDGLKRSTNGGGTFVPVTGGPATGDAWSIKAFSATDLVCTAQNTSGSGSIYYSTDAGATWTLAAINGLGTITPGRMTVTAVPGGTAGYAEVEDTSASKIARGVLVTGDKGHTWTWQAAATELGGLFQGTGGGMTGDGGQSWYNQAIAVDPTNPSRLIMGANLAMYRSTNGGANWQQMTQWYGSQHVYSHADFHTVAYKGGMFYVGNDGGLSIFKDPWRASLPTSNPDPTFMDNTRNLGLVTHLIYNVGSTTDPTTALDGKYRISLGMQDNGTRIRQNTGSGLSASSTFEDRIGGDGFGTVINPADGTQFLGSVYYTDIYRSTDGGANFSESITGITEANSSTKAPFQPRLALGDTAHPNTVYTATNGTVYQSTTFGRSWTGLSRTGLPAAGTSSSSDPASALYIRNLGAAAGDPKALGIAANTGRVFLSYNGGSSWAQAGTLTNNGSYTSSIWFDRTNSQIVYVASVAPDATRNHLWKSTNGGASWSTLDGSATTSNGFPFGIPVHVVVTDPTSANTVYAGTDFGVYFSVDGGSNWSRFGSGMPLVAVRDLYIAPDASFLRAATFGRGVWELQPAPKLAVSLYPSAATMINGATLQFYPVVSNGTQNTVTWSATYGTAPTGVTASGTYEPYTAPATGTSDTLTVTTVDTPTATASAPITFVSPSSVSVSISPAVAEVIAGNAIPFSASVTPLTDQGVTWGGQGMGSNGLFVSTGLANGTYTVTATSSESPTSTPGTATVTVMPQSAVSVSVTPATAVIILRSPTQFTATVTGPALASDRTVQWGTGANGTITPSGLFTPDAVGPYTITATNFFSGVVGTATGVVKTLDLNGDGTVDVRDLLTFAKQYGATGVTSTSPAYACDLNGDGKVDDADLTILLSGM